MATRLENTFRADASGTTLLGKLKPAQSNVDGVIGVATAMKPPHAARRLHRDEDSLKRDFLAIWSRCTIEYDPKQPAAEIRKGKEIVIGPLFAEQRFTTLDMEKVLLHEYLHAALDEMWKLDPHSQIDQIIQFNLKYPGAPNPAVGLI
jgi:hypothetical protein